jgi:hypothetical protein
VTIATLANYDSAFKQELYWSTGITGANIAALNFNSLSQQSAIPGIMTNPSNTTNGVVPVAGDTGFPAVQPIDAAASVYITRINTFSNLASGTGSRLYLFDRLYHVGMFADTPATYNFSSQPSFLSRLPGGRYEGLYLLCEAQASSGSNAPNITVTYVNQAGVSGRSTGTFAIGRASFRLDIVPLQAGDNGIQQITSLVVGGSSGSNNFSLVIARPLFQHRFDELDTEYVFPLERIGMPQIYSTSALFWAFRKDQGTSNQPNFRMGVEIAAL